MSVQNTDVGYASNARASLRTWRRFCALSGLLLASTFFLPIGECNAPPYDAVFDLSDFVLAGPDATWYADRYDRAGQWRSFSQEALNSFVMYVPPFLFGGLVALAAAARLGESRSLHVLLSWFVASLLVLVAMLVLAGTWLDHFEPGISWGLIDFSSSGFSFIPCVAIPCVLLPWVAWTSRLKSDAVLCHGLIGSTITLCWALWWLRNDSAPRLVTVVAIASAALLVCSVAEARALSGMSWWRTTWRLVTGMRLPRADLGPFCRRCGYCLIGLPERRCPECGRRF